MPSMQLRGITCSLLASCVLAVVGVALDHPRRIAGGTVVNFVSNPEYAFIVTLYVDSGLRCPGVALSTSQIMTAASCFETGGDGSDSIFDGELQTHKTQDTGTEGARLVIEVEQNSYSTWAAIPDANKKIVGSVQVHPNYDQTCGTDYDVAILTLLGGSVLGAGQQLAQLDSGSLSASMLAAGWGVTSAGQSATGPGGNLLIAGITLGGTCTDHWPEFNDEWQICSTNSGVCEHDDGAVLFYMSSGTPVVAGLLSQVGGDGCPQAYARWTRVSAYQDFICSVVGCSNTAGADSTGMTGLCRWTAIKVHAILCLIFCVGVLPFSIGVQLLTYETAKQKDGQVQLHYMDDYPNIANALLVLELGGFVFLLIPALVVVAVGVAPRNVNGGHSWLGYIILVMIAIQIVVTVVLRTHGGDKRFNDPLGSQFFWRKVATFNGFLTYVLILYVEVPLGILQIGYGIGPFFGWWAYLAVLHIMHLVYSKTAQTVVRPSTKVAPEISKLDEADGKSRQGTRRASAAARAKSVSPTRRQSLNDHHRPYFVKDQHVGREERSQKRRESVAAEMRERNSTNVFEKFGDAITRRKSFTEGLAEFYDKMTTQPERESQRLSVAKNKGDNWKAIRRASTNSGRGSYEGPRETDEDAVTANQQRRLTQKASMRRGSLTNMNG